MKAFASGYLWVLGTVFLVGYALPLLFTPLRWAKLFRWRLPDDPNLTRYFGRCLGGVAVPLTLLCLRTASHPEAQPWLFELLTVIGALLMGVHIAGAVEKSQPWPEHVEIGVYALAGAMALWIRLSLNFS